ncbi:MAG: hypothetical protein HYZ20_13265 [Burkholderiales bacterium]|nr:hypothetical protein [Burkholderiales bacterium]
MRRVFIAAIIPFLVACGTRAKAPSPSLAQAGAAAISMSGLAALCDPQPEDQDLLDGVDQEDQEDWRQPVTRRSSIWLFPLPLAAGPWVAPICEGVGNTPAGDGTCELPVLVRQIARGRCEAELPFARYCVKQDAGGVAPIRIRFVLAKEDSSDPRGYVEWTDNAPGPYEFVPDASAAPAYGQVQGIHLQEGRKKPPRGNYFVIDMNSRSAGGQAFTLGIGKENTDAIDEMVRFRNGQQARLKGGVLSAAFVRQKAGAPGPAGVCRPTDPIIVNVAN